MTDSLLRNAGVKSVMEVALRWSLKDCHNEPLRSNDLVAMLLTASDGKGAAMLSTTEAAARRRVLPRMTRQLISVDVYKRRRLR